MNSEQRLNNMAAQVDELQSGVHLAAADSLPFAYEVGGGKWLERAISRVGEPPTDRNQDLFYAFFREMCGSGPSELRALQYPEYLSHLRPPGTLPYVDLGAGDGDFILYLARNGYPAVGVDTNPTEVEKGRVRGANMVQADALEYLQGCPPGSLDGVFMLQVVEHLEPEMMRRILKATVTALNSGGKVIIETINLRHPLALQGFYTDPTHTRPVADDYLEFLLEWDGLTDLHKILTVPVSPDGPGPFVGDESRVYYNYAVIATKP